MYVSNVCYGESLLIVYAHCSCRHSLSFSVELKHEGLRPDPLHMSETSVSCFFPSISLVNSMPVIPEELMQIARTTSWDQVSKGGRKLDDRVKSAKPSVRRKPKGKTLREKHIIALLADKAAGGPFKLYLQR